MEKELSDVRESRKVETEKLKASLEELKVSMQKREAEMETLKEDKTGLEREVADMNKLRTAKEELAQQLKVRRYPLLVFYLKGFSILLSTIIEMYHFFLPRMCNKGPRTRPGTPTRK